jgi:putative ABC transport system permease protein
VDDVRQYALGAAPGPQVYLPYGATDAWTVSEIVVRSALPAETIVNSIRGAVRELDRNQPVTSIYTMTDVLHQSTARPRFNALLVGAFAATALALAVVGIYGVISYGVAERRREIGVRLALGAGRREVLKLVGGQGMIVVAIGLLLGLAGSAVLTTFLEGLLFDIKPLDPLTYLGAASIMLIASAAACVVPTLRATRIDPSEALRTP